MGTDGIAVNKRTERLVGTREWKRHWSLDLWAWEKRHGFGRGKEDEHVNVGRQMMRVRRERVVRGCTVAELPRASTRCFRTAFYHPN